MNTVVVQHYPSRTVAAAFVKWCATLSCPTAALVKQSPRHPLAEVGSGATAPPARTACTCKPYWAILEMCALPKIRWWSTDSPTGSAEHGYPA